MISSLNKQKKSIAKSSHSSLSFNKNRNNKDQSSYFTLKQRLQLFKLRKKPRKQIILRFSTITNGLQLPNLQTKQNVLNNQSIKLKLAEKFKVQRNDNLSNAKNYIEKGNRICISAKKTGLSFIQTQDKHGTLIPYNISLDSIRSRNVQQKQAELRKKNNKLRNLHGQKLRQYTQFQDITKQSTKSQFLKNLTVQDLYRTKNQFYTSKMRNYYDNQKLKLNKRILQMEGMVYQKSEDVINNA